MLKKISDALKDHPYLVVFMFVIALLSGVMQIVMGWKDFYRDYLSKSAEVPVWLIVFLMVAFAVLLVLANGRSLKVKPFLEFEVVDGKEFGVQRVVLDGRKFVSCKFVGSELVYRGDSPFGLMSCNLDRTFLTFEGGAGNAVAALAMLSNDPGMRELSNAIMQAISSGAVPVRPQYQNFE